MTVALQGTSDPRTLVLARFVSMLAEDAMFALASGTPFDALEDFGKRRAIAYEALLAGRGAHRMMESFDGWLAEVVLASAAVAPAAWLPMGEVIREKVTLEVGARGLRSLFSSKPSEKDIQRVKRLGALTVRMLRAVFAADGALDLEERRSIALLVKSLGLPDEDASAMLAEESVTPESIDVFGEIEAPVAKAMVRGAWLAAVADGLDGREDAIVRMLASRLGVSGEECEAMKSATVARVDARKLAGHAVIEAVRFVLPDRVPGYGQSLAAHAGLFFLPRVHRDEALASVSPAANPSAPVQLAKRYRDLSTDDKERVLGVAWAAALWDDPTIARRALLRARHDRIAQDLGIEGNKPRELFESWLSATLAPAAFPMGGG